MREKLELEYTLKSSPKLLFPRLSTPEGLTEWFAEKVTADKDLFSFSWDKSESHARLSAIKENKFVRFEWADRGEEEANYFEFRINIDDITGDLALIITDFCSPEERDDITNLWDTQVIELKRILGT
ncbi:MAG: START-like domain-containing protein [Bacteroidales bacterium]